MCSYPRNTVFVREGFVVSFFPLEVCEAEKKLIWIFLISFGEKRDSVPISGEKCLFFPLSDYF